MDSTTDKMDAKKREELVRRLRRELKLATKYLSKDDVSDNGYLSEDDVSDNDLLEGYENTLTLSRIYLGMSSDELKKELSSMLKPFKLRGK